MKPLISWDTETELMEMGCLVPRLICLSASARNTSGALDSWLASSAAKQDHDTLERLLDVIFNPDVEMVLQNAPFDLVVIAQARPERWPQVWDALVEGRVHDIIIREKLLNLTTHGRLKTMSVAEGVGVALKYDLASLEKKYLGTDRTHQKESEEHWRHHFRLLDGIPASEYPAEARDYAIVDAQSPLLIFEHQEAERQKIIAERGVDPFKVSSFRTCANFAFWLCSAWGLTTDPVEFQRISEMLDREYHSYDKNNLLIDAGFMVPAQPPRPYARGVVNEDGTPKMTKPQNAKMKMKALAAYVETLCEKDPTIVLKRTDKGSVSIDKDWREQFADRDPVLMQYHEREKLKKLVTTELPRLMDSDRAYPAARVHPSYDVLKETGRSSSYGHDKWPSLNIQNVDPRARGIVVPSDGYYLFSVDYSQMELGTLAQTCLDLFGFSVLAEKINKGYDLHAYLGAQIAMNTQPVFAQLAADLGTVTHDDQYALFKAYENELKGSPGLKFYKHFRGLAKPTGLGYPGGLGPKTFIAFARSPYGVNVSYGEAKRLREIWMSTFPEMEHYFNHINKKCKDPWNKIRRFDDEKQKWISEQAYRYVTPFGMLRSGAAYCPVSNGKGLQSPSAEGAMTGLFNVTRACYDKRMGSILYDTVEGPAVRTFGFIHDELLGEVRNDRYLTRRMHAIDDIMVRSMRIVTPDVEARASVAVMDRWDKEATSQLDENGNYTIWRTEKGAA